MSSQNSESTERPSSERPQFEPGQMVKTPSGSHAELVAIYQDVGEALVQWSNGERGRFRLGVLRPVPETKP
jgi:hypothetical protein